MDFTIEKYEFLIKTLLKQKYSFHTFRQYIELSIAKSITLRHDVDRLPQNSLRFARIQNEKGIKGTYYFRAVPESWDESIIKEIHDLGHEIGYHYESLTTCKGNMEEAIIDFEMNLAKLRKIAPVSTICMHGSPRSPYDNKDLWKHYNYRDFGIVGEPYFDTDFSEVLYLTDTGRRWDGEKVSVRDRINVQSSKFKVQSFHRTSEIILAAEKGELPDKIMFTFHPQRWTDKPLPWLKELVLQNAKNLVKRYFFVKK
jgi:hypothetical protein